MGDSNYLIQKTSCPQHQRTSASLTYKAASSAEIHKHTISDRHILLSSFQQKQYKGGEKQGGGRRQQGIWKESNEKGGDKIVWKPWDDITGQEKNTVKQSILLRIKE